MLVFLLGGKKANLIFELGRTENKVTLPAFLPKGGINETALLDVRGRRDVGQWG